MLVNQSPKITFQPFHENETFKNFIYRFELYTVINNYQNSKTKVYLFLSTLTPELHQKAHDLCSPDDPATLPFEKLVKILEDYIVPKPSVFNTNLSLVLNMKVNQ